MNTLVTDVEKTRRRIRDKINKASSAEVLASASLLGIETAEVVPVSELVLAEIDTIVQQSLKFPPGRSPALLSRVDDVLKAAGNLLPRRFEVWVVCDDVGERGRKYLNRETAEANREWLGGKTVTTESLNVLEIHRVLAHIKPYLSLSEREIFRTLERAINSHK